ncbi:MAG: hypothetical protein HN704_05035 [Bacteroidetes bacterium]|jgi:hypothetical protein|nr:hypothetical protein [Bacteroidota bacterium]MBT6685901.1 hypothetical protein [Bacteroidota bacterium]MBT7144035.1 hypothetical protein [Bacteroidota bacterium]MBT7490957.1 hypothetical protein [Bacteroidota bacterium]
MKKISYETTKYIDYICAAEMHLASYKELSKRIDIQSRYYLKNETDKRKIMHEMYYLSGYIIESSLCYAIGIEIDEKNEDADLLQKNVKYFGNSNLQPHGKVKFKGLFAEDQHATTEKIKFLREISGFNSSRINEIPILDNRTPYLFHHETNKNIHFQTLYESWRPDYRYIKPPKNIRDLIFEQNLLNDYKYFLFKFVNKIKRHYNRTLKLRTICSYQ